MPAILVVKLAVSGPSGQNPGNLASEIERHTTGLGRGVKCIQLVVTTPGRGSHTTIDCVSTASDHQGHICCAVSIGIVHVRCFHHHSAVKQAFHPQPCDAISSQAAQVIEHLGVEGVVGAAVATIMNGLLIETLVIQLGNLELTLMITKPMETELVSLHLRAVTAVSACSLAC